MNNTKEDIISKMIEIESEGYYVNINIERLEEKNPKKHLINGEVTGIIPLKSYFEEEIEKYLSYGSKITFSRGREIVSILDKKFMENIKITESGNHKRLFIFNPERTVYSLERIKHYTSTKIEDFQRYMLLTNYSFYMDSFATLFQNEDLVFSERKDCQMPVIHMKKPNNQGITIVNIGVSPANAKNITDHLAVLRPKLFLLLGHAGGLRYQQNKGDFVIPDKFFYDGSLMGKIFEFNIPIIPTIGFNMYIIKYLKEKQREFRIGTVVTTEDRNWELNLPYYKKMFDETKAVGIDMESAIIAAQGFKYKIPNGIILAVSDKPLHGDIKSANSSKDFYKSYKEFHIESAIEIINGIKEKFKDGNISHSEYANLAL